MVRTDDYGDRNIRCNVCGVKLTEATDGHVYCSLCYNTFVDYGCCKDCGLKYEGTPCNNTTDCSNCEDGKVSVKSTYCPDHTGASYGHYWCSTHSYNCGSSNSHSYCSHSRTSQHDD